VIDVSRKDRGKMIGPGGERIKLAKEFARRHHGVTNIKLQVID